MGYYAQLDKNGYCCCVSSLSGAMTESDMIALESYDMQYLGRKYNKNEERWTDEYKTNPEPIKPEATNAMLMEKLEMQEQSSLDQEEMLLNQQILLLNVELNTTI